MLIYVCRRCGHVLYTYPSNKRYRGIETPVSVASVAARCPKCGSELLTKPSLSAVEVRIVG